MGLRAGDLKNLLDNVFEVDNYKSKMGDDEDIVVVSFSVQEQNAAKDLVEFIEKSYDFVLDADSTVSEVDEGRYKVFVELERDRSVQEHIMEMLYGITQLSEVEGFKFRYHKNFKSHDANIDKLHEIVPIDATTYTLAVTENADTFFGKTPAKIEFFGENFIIKKEYADPIGFKIKDFGKTNYINENIKEKINVNDYAELLFYTKYLGDYNITKFGNNTLTFENKGYTLVVERM
jgi:hypothetical protein|tara:strand:+ start:865 stop:1566 length:702 start_codon:yes stop_codon:yes gene_type:complete